MFGDNGAHDWIEPPKKPRKPRESSPDALLAQVQKALEEYPVRTHATCMEDVYRDWLRALVARVEQAEAEVAEHVRQWSVTNQRLQVAEADLAKSREGNRQLGQAHIDASNTLAEAEAALAALRLNLTSMQKFTDEIKAECAALRQRHAEALADGYVLAMRLLQSDIIADDTERVAMEHFLEAKRGLEGEHDPQ